MNFIERALHTRRYEVEGSAFRVTARDECLNPHATLTMGERNEYVLELTVGTRYDANRAERDQVRRRAEKLLLQYLYQDALIPLSELRAACLYREFDRKTIEMWLDRLEEAIEKGKGR